MFKRKFQFGLALVVVLVYVCVSAFFIRSSKNIIDVTCENALVDFLHLSFNEESHLDTQHNTRYIREWFGWHKAEDWGTWSKGAASFLYVNVGSADNGDACVSMSGWSLLSAKHPQTRIEVFIGDHSAGGFTQTLGQPSGNGVIRIPRSTLAKSRNGNVVLKLTTPDATSPSSAGLNDDTRILGFGLSSLQLVHCAP